MLRKLARDLALTLYDHPTEFLFMSLPRVGFAAFGLMFGITWYREAFLGIKFSSWTSLTTGLGICAGAYAFKKVAEGRASNAPSQPVGTQGTGDRESG